MDKYLGFWATNTPSISQAAYLVKATSQLYIRQTNGGYVCHKFVSGTMSTYKPTEHQSIVLPPEAEFTPITCRNGHIICSGLIEMFSPNMESGRPPPVTFQDYMGNLNPTLHHLQGNLGEQDINAELWIQALKEGRVTIASDGSVKSQTGTYAVIFQADESVICFQGPVDCHTDLLQTSSH
eukprot:3028446-Ditylum_brightwellii.AAC.1